MHNDRQRGFTIIEIMIVLAIMGLAFLMAITFASGKQETSSFNSGAQAFNSNVQSVMNQVTSGQYDDAPLACTVQGGVLSISVGSDSALGDDSYLTNNNNCVFLGKILQFVTTQNSYSIYTAAGPTAETSNVATYNPADTTVLPVIVNGQQGPNLTVESTIPDSLQIVDFSYQDSSCPAATNHTCTVNASNSTLNLGFFQSQSLESFQSGGAENLYMYAATISSDGSVSVGPVLTSADVCVTDGTRYAELQFGGSNSSDLTNVTLKTLGLTKC